MGEKTIRGLYSEIFKGSEYNQYSIGFEIGKSTTWDNFKEYYIQFDLWYWTVEVGIRV